jgi:hypothetical protein
MSAKLNVDIVAQLKDFNKAMVDLKGEVQNMGSTIDKTNADTIKSTKKMSGAFSEVGKTLAGVFAVDQLINFGKKILDTTVEFQKMEAVLSTTLGSSSAAKAAMDQIVDFASSTPFQVNELTDAFVKLSNRGFVPTMAQMRQMGDVASSVGKSFDQLTEAILDAQTGEFERLKEFGIKASSQGDVVQFTFKGITTEVAKSDKAIQEYILSLGNLEGVAGSMEAISKTTGGAISNLEDNVTQLFKNIGDSSTGFLNWFIKDINNVISSLRNFGEIVELLNPFKTISESSEEARTYLLRVNDSTDDLEITIKDVASAFDKMSIATLLGADAQKLFVDTLVEQGNSIEDSKALLNTYIGLRKKQYDAERLLASATKTTTDKTKELTAEEKKQIEARQKAHQDVLKFSRSYELQMQDTTYATEEFTKAIAAKISEIGKIPKAGVLLKTYEDLFRKPITTAPFIETPNLADGFTPTIEVADVDESEVTKKLLSFKAKAEEFRQAANAALQQGAVDTVTGFAGAIGAAFAGGENAFQSFGQALLGNLGMIMQQLGKAAIGIGITMDAIKKAFTNPFTAIAAGIALVAVGKFISTKVAGMTSGGGSQFSGSTNIGGQNAGLTPFAAGGIVSGPTAALVGEYPGARTNPEVIAPLNKLQNMLGGNVTFTISGDNLVGTLNRANKTRARKF